MEAFDNLKRGTKAAFGRAPAGDILELLQNGAAAASAIALEEGP